MKVGLIGAGNMARAMARGWGGPVLASDSGSGRARALAEELGGEALESNLAVAERSDLVVLCHKPAQLKPVSLEIADHVKAVASVLGGVSGLTLQDAYPGVPVFALLPNTPVEVRRGVICYSPVPGIDGAVEAQVIELFERLGKVVRIPQRLMEAATVVSGVGPAFLAVVAEAQVDAAVRHGLPPALAGRLAADAMSGTAALLEARDFDTLAVRREVASPGGTTVRGLAALDRAGLRAAFQDATDAVIDGGAR
jgi:pyrroline-5-carboxylate reductase